MFILAQNLKLLKHHLKNWNKETFGNVYTHVSNVVAKLDSFQVQINARGPTDLLRNQRKGIQIKLDESLKIEELFLARKGQS